MEEITKKTEEILEVPESSPLKYIEGDEEFEKSFLSGVETVFEILRAGEDDISEVITKGFTREQIWQQIDLLNGKLENTIPMMARWIARKKQLAVPVKTLVPGESENEKVEVDSNGGDNSGDEDKEEEESDIEEEEEEEDEDDDKDRFFNIKEMEKFADMDAKDEDIDLFENEDSGSEREDVKYDDFFGEKDEDTGFDENEDSESDEHKSTFEKRKDALETRIRKMEDEAVGEKPWVLKGEADSSKRPVNSLLEEVLEFDTAQRPAPVITEEVTMKLEDIIKKRIKDETYDDVERKIKPVKLPHEFKKQIVLDQEKSKLSLAQIYENEFLNQKSKETKEVKEEELSEEKKKIAEKMKTVFHQLDILCNLHYTPKMGDTELKVVSNIPAINMEEVAPVAMTDADRLAPGEVAGKFKRDLIGKEERTKTDKKREKRKKKALQSKKANFKNSTQNIKINKSNMLQKDDGQNMKTSTAFFNRLQDQVENKKRKSDVEKPRFQAKKLKL